MLPTVRGAAWWRGMLLRSRRRVTLALVVCVCWFVCFSSSRVRSKRATQIEYAYDLGRVCRYFHDPRLPLSNLFVTEVAQALHDAVYAQVRTRLSHGLATAGARHTGTSSAHRQQPESKPTVPSARRDAVSLCMTARRGSASCSTGRSRSTSCAAASSRARACSRRASVGVRRRHRRVSHHAYDAFPTHTRGCSSDRARGEGGTRRSDTETLTHH